MFSVEVVVITFVGTRREAKRLRVSSAMCRLLEVHYVSTERLLAALQIAVGGFLGSRSRSACSLPHGSRTPAGGGYPRLIVLTVYGLVPFISVSTI